MKVRDRYPASDPTAVGGLSLDAHGLSEQGRARRVNQDEYLLAPFDSSIPAAGPMGLFAVADGIGGGPAGDRASALAIRTLHEFVWRTAADPDLMRTLDPGELLRRAIFRCHDEILFDVAEHPELAGMGSTLTAALVAWPKLWVAHAGDSRCNLLRGSRLERLTHDHLVADRLIEEGVLTPDAARHSAWRRTLWNHLGKISAPVEAEVATAELRPGDALLLTTDGITDRLSDPALEAISREPASARVIAEKILRSAQDEGGRDDMTVVFVRFIAASSRAADRPSPSP